MSDGGTFSIFAGCFLVIVGLTGLALLAAYLMRRFK